MEIGEYYFINAGGFRLSICKITKKEVDSNGSIFFIKDSFTILKYRHNEGICLTYIKGSKNYSKFCNNTVKLEKEEGEKRWKEFKDLYEKIVLKDFNIENNVS